ncbi:hypothetical protein GALL_504420 [mine drainage metagenome]|uniref:Yip1 domain protein n=1 Tax=mine drainage metagenome TaxID=410659 RepID=A0A1J5P9T9_9ZZZZ
MKRGFYEFKNIYLFIVIALYYLIVDILMNAYIYTSEYYHSVLSAKLDNDQINQVITNNNDYRIVVYLLIPIFLIAKIWIISGIIYIGLIFLNKSTTYSSCLKIALFAELIFVVATVIKLGWLLIHKPGDITDIQFFSPLAITQVIDIKKISKYFLYPLQLFNIFEIAYWFMLAYGIMIFTGWRYGKSLKAVAASYGVALAVWVVLVLFIQVQLS